MVPPDGQDCPLGTKPIVSTLPINPAGHMPDAVKTLVWGSAVMTLEALIFKAVHLSVMVVPMGIFAVDVAVNKAGTGVVGLMFWNRES